MKHIKTFEKTFENISIPINGDYVILIPEKLRGYDQINKVMFKNFIDNNIGQIFRTRSVNNVESERILNVSYDYPPKNKEGFMYDFGIKKYYVSVYEKNILAFAKTTEELKQILLTNKYNI